MLSKLITPARHVGATERTARTAIEGVKTISYLERRGIALCFGRKSEIKDLSLEGWEAPARA
jgi:hypothetical protein